ncbi:MAG: RdgB/HAM1 family non-canonical purine NTP pyrophosphatase [Proteobacteria bacterium]|nr:RdgB/HAM1 family non-canonical purine NTP pyrophosphatase [Pseudomonadota bacterium]
MARRFAGGRLTVASHNSGKVREIRELMAPFGVAVVTASDLGLAEPDETGASFAANAEIKARGAALATRGPALADDSGLVVPALGGAPGIHSARWAGPGRDFAAAMRRLEAELADREAELADGADRRAYFAAALALAWPDGHCETFEGRVDGALVFPPRGQRGFGYDPVFVPDGHDETFGEMDPAEKRAISHRARAMRKLLAACFDGSAER